MYDIKDSDFEEFKEICKVSLEPGEPVNCEDYEFHKLVYGDKVICMLGLATDDKKTYMVGTFTDLAKTHLRTLVEVGRAFLFSISSLPVEVIIEDNNKKFKRFAEFFGFKKTLAQQAVNDIMYTTYVKGSE